MRVLVGAEGSGSLKEVIFPIGINTSNKDDVEPTINTFQSEGRANHIQKIVVINDIESGPYVAVARKGCVVQLYHMNDLENPISNWLMNGKDLNDNIIGMEYVSGILYTYSCFGCLVARSLVSKDPGSDEIMVQPGPGLAYSAFTVHPNQPNMIARGGKDQELEIIELFSLRNNMQGSFVKFPPEGGIVEKRLFRAKNVKNDELDLVVPVWISDIRFLDLDRPYYMGFRVVISTRFGHIRVYDTVNSRRPIINVEVSDSPLYGISYGPTELQIVYTDTHTTTTLFDLDKQKIVGKYKGQTGANWALDSWIIKKETADACTGYLATGGLDRFLRVFELKTRKLVGKVFLGTKINAVRFIDIESDASIKDDSEAVETGEQYDDVWDNLESEAKENERTKRRRKD